MKILCLLTVLVLSSTLLHAQEITFTKSPPTRGLVIEQLDTLHLDLAFSVEGSDETLVKMKNRQYNRSAITVLDVNSDGILRYSLQVHEAWESGKTPGSGRTQKSTHGRSYIIERRGDSTIVFREDGGVPSPAERAEIVQERGQKTLGGIAEYLDGRTMRTGEALLVEKELLESFKNVLGSTPATLKAASMKLIDIRDVQNMRCGIFELNLTFGGTQAGAEIESDIKGELTMAAETLWPVSIVMTGDIRGVGMWQGTSMSVGGDVKGAMISTYIQR